MIERAIIADLGGFADHDAHAVIDEQAAADARPGVDLDPGQYPPDMRHEAAGQIPAVLPQPMREAIIEQSLKPGIAQHDFEPRSGRRIARQSRIYLVSQVSERHRRHYVIVRIPVGRHWRVATRGTPRQHIIVQLMRSSMRARVARSSLSHIGASTRLKPSDFSRVCHA